MGGRLCEAGEERAFWKRVGGWKSPLNNREVCKPKAQGLSHCPEAQLWLWHRHSRQVATAVGGEAC